MVYSEKPAAVQSRLRRARIIKHRDCAECGKKLDDNRVSRCATCLLRNAVSAASYRVSMKPELLRKAKEFRDKVKDEVFKVYGGWICACCKEIEKEFLSLDHIYGGGNQQRKILGRINGHRFYLWLRAQSFPKGYQVLCMNCNFAKRYTGVCPHQRKEITSER